MFQEHWQDAGALQSKQRAWAVSHPRMLAMYLARRLPYVWDTARGALGFDDVKEHASDFFSVKTGGSQASLAIRELDDVLKTLDGKTIESFEAKVYLETGNPAFDRYFAAHAKA